MQLYKSPRELMQRGRAAVPAACDALGVYIGWTCNPFCCLQTPCMHASGKKRDVPLGTYTATHTAEPKAPHTSPSLRTMSPWLLDCWTLLLRPWHQPKALRSQRWMEARQLLPSNCVQMWRRCHGSMTSLWSGLCRLGCGAIYRLMHAHTGTEPQL